MLKTALQLYSIRSVIREHGFADVVKRVADMGYDGVELAGTYGLDAKEMRAAADAAGIPVVSAHIPFAEMVKDPEFFAEYFDIIGCPQAVIPYKTNDTLPGGENFAETDAGIKMLSDTFKKRGIVLAYHNHDLEFEKINGKRILDTIYEIYSPDVLQTQIDTCWVNVAGVDPAAYIRSYKGRCPTVHLKDFVGSKKGCPYALLGQEEKKAEDTGTFEFRPCGYGVQDFSAIMLAAEESGAEWQIVEQDNPSMGKSSMECAKMSIDYLKGLGK